MNKKVIFDQNIKSLDTVGHGSIRKSTLGVVAVLGLSFLGATAIQGPSVSADEVTASDASTTVVADTTTQTTDTTAVADTSSVADTTTYESTSAVAADDTTEQVATEVSEVTPVEDTVAQTDTTTQESTDTSVVTPQAEELDETAEVATDNEKTEVVVNDNNLTSAINEAKEAGVNVKQNGTVNKGTATTTEEAEALESSIKNNYKDTIETLKEATEEAKANQEANKKIAEMFDTINNQNTLGANDGWVASVGENGYTQSGTSQFKKAQNISGVELVATGSLEPGKAQVYVKGDVDQSHVIKNINWGNVAPEGDNLNGNIGTDWAGAYDYNTNGTTTQIWKGKISTWYKISNAITMLDGSVHDAYVLFHSDTSGLSSPSDDVVFWNQDGAINAVDGYRTGVNDKSDGIRTVIRVDSPDNEDNYLWISLLGDFDIGQYLEAENDVVVLGVGGGFATNSGVGGNPVAVDENLGLTYGKNITPTSALTGFNSAPDGVALIAQYGREYSTVIRNTAGGNGVAVARADFGANAEVEITMVTDVSASYHLESYTLEDAVTTSSSEAYGDVIVHYVNTNGNTIASDVVDTNKTLVSTTVTTNSSLNGTSSSTTKSGVTYDTTDNKPTTITTEDGKTYKIVPELTKGNETGEVTEGTTNVTYVYNEILGDVVVTYKDEDGNVIHEQVTDTPESSIGTNYDTTDNKIQTIVTEDGKTYQLTGIPNNETGKVVEGRTVVPYVYSELKGDVIVHYVSEEGETIKGDVTDTPESSTGTKYDTTDNKPTTITTEDGRTFDIVPSDTKGNETGKVVVGTTEVTYVYKEVLGDVIVHYVDANGNTIAADVTDTPETSTGTKYDTTDNKPASIAVTDEDGNVTIYNINTDKTEGNETGEVVRGTTEVTYVYDVAQATPVKTVKLEDGQDADGKTVLANSTLIYNVDIDNDNYKDVMSSLSSEQEQVGVTVIEDLDEAHVTANLDASRVVVKGSTTAVDGFYFTYYASRDEAPESVQTAYDEVVASGHTVNGGFVAVTSYAPTATEAEQANQNLTYTRNILNKGINLDIVLVTTVNADVDANEIDNTAHQVDFSGAKTTNTTVNNTPDINPEKDIVASVSDGLKNQNSLDGKTVNVGDTYDFELQGSTFSNLAEGLKTYGFTDTFSSLVQYDGVNSWFANVDITLADGTTIAKGTDISEYVTQTITYNEDGTTSVDYEFDTDFLKSIDWTGNFQVVGYAQVKQVGEGTVENTFNEVVNGAVYSSNTVTVSTPTPEEPETPATPSTPIPTNATPVQAAALGTVELPKTGDSSNGMAILGAELLATVALAGVALKRKRAK